jgi:hypothetical protein
VNVVKYLNAIIQGEERTEPTPNEAALALFHIETTELAVNALRQITLHPKNPEAFARAARYLALHDGQLAARQHAAALVAAPTVGAQPVAAATSEVNQDVSDLV